MKDVVSATTRPYPTADRSHLKEMLACTFWPGAKTYPQSGPSSSTMPIDVPTPPSGVYFGVMPQLIQREEPGWLVSFTCTQHVDPDCIASHRVTLLHGLIIALPSGVTTLLPAGLFRLVKLRHNAHVHRG